MGHLSGPNPCPGVLGASYVAIFALFLGASEEQFGASSAPIVLGRSLKRANMGFFIGKIKSRHKFFHVATGRATSHRPLAGFPLGHTSIRASIDAVLGRQYCALKSSVWTEWMQRQ